MTTRTTKQTSIGVYRWDAYHGGEGAIYETVRKCLGPARYHDKLPFFGAAHPDGTVDVDDTDESSKMDDEISYARNGGVDYWIFLRYIDLDLTHAPMNKAYRTYLRSPRKGEVGFCWMLSHSLGDINVALWDDEKKKTIEAMQDGQWMRVLDNRPLLYLYQDCARPSLKSKLDELRSLARERGLAEPYIVAISFDPEPYGCDARTEWPRSGGHGDPATAFSEVVTSQNQHLLTSPGKAVLAAPVNWDSRPYHDHPPAWWKDPPDAWYRMPTSAEYRDRVQDAVDRSQARSGWCEANTLFVYAWNEFTEGGIMCPTRRMDGTIDTTILDGLAGVNKGGSGKM